MLVTGASGYLGTQLIARYCPETDGRSARRFARWTRADGVRTRGKPCGADDTGLEVVTAELTCPTRAGRPAAGVEEATTPPRRSRSCPAARSRRSDRPGARGHAARLGRRARRGRQAGGAHFVLRRDRLHTEAGRRVLRGRLDRPRHARPAALPAVQDDRRARRLGVYEDRGRRHRAGRGQPDVHTRAAADDERAFVDAA